MTGPRRFGPQRRRSLEERDRSVKIILLRARLGWIQCHNGDVEDESCRMRASKETSAGLVEAYGEAFTKNAGPALAN